MHVLKNFKLGRRQVLRGLFGGTVVGVGLPLLEAMLDANGEALADGSGLPVRFMTWYWADGIVIDEWEPAGGMAPAGVNADWDLSPQLAPLANVKDYINVVTGMQNRSERWVTHHEGMTGFNGYTFEDAGGLDTNAAGPTIDQLIADVVASRTTIRSVAVRVSKRESTDGDGGTTVIAMSHRGTPGNLIAQVPQANPQQVWASLFGEFVPRPDDRSLRTSILDHVRADADRLRERLGTQDRQRLDAHLQGVSELEQRILATPPPCTLPEMPTQDNTDTGGVEPISSVNLAMAELLRYAFVCDITRVASFMLKKFVSATVFDEIGAGEIHHTASHLGPSDEDYRAGIVYQMQRFADLLELFQSTEEANGQNLLDSTIIYATSDCSTGSAHSIARQPILLAGHGRGYLRNPGIHYQATPWNGDHFDPNGAENMSDVLLTCLQAFEPSADGVGAGNPRSTTPLDEIKA
jgi:hypothetical protein